MTPRLGPSISAPMTKETASGTIEGAGDAVRLKRIRFRAWRRGFKEADLLLGGFADRFLDDLDAVDLDRFEALLTEDDHELYAWMLGRAPTPERHDHALMARLVAFASATKDIVGAGGSS